MIKIRYSVLAGLLFALIMLIYLAITSKMDIAIVVSIFIFIVSPFLFYFKMFSKVDFDEKFQKINKSLVVYSGLASHLKDGITVGGTLYLFSDRLIFQTNLINFIKRHEQVIMLNQIVEINTVNSLGFINNSLLLKNRNAEVEKFVVAKREVWKEQIEKQITQIAQI